VDVASFNDSLTSNWRTFHGYFRGNAVISETALVMYTFLRNVFGGGDLVLC